ncbi:DNA-binding domain-containing protein [Chryseolinea lacunae]|uniref:DUF4469 domain-containing protein n=1 Tax=Chryseolinea lacunae TaxID=2801331 RepID=A0ABS1KW85_9BACT|nr:DNA-binding domain-containing protein [Chryseolinea lacunae]MBL0743487.1 DUF4469 domain-containing protein [Chryseolinea lacunae]
MVKYMLFENPLTPDPDDQKAVVVPISTKSMEEVVDMMISRGSTVTKAEALSVLEELSLAVAQLVKDGHNVVSPLFNVSLSIRGTFADANDSFDAARHTISVRVQPGLRLKEMVSQIRVEKIMSFKPLPILQSFKDLTSKADSTATPGGVAHIAGSALKFDAANAAQGVFFTALNGTLTKVDVIADAKPSKIIFIIPATLAAGEYSISVRTLMAGTKEMREGFLIKNVTVK